MNINELGRNVEDFTQPQTEPENPEVAHGEDAAGDDGVTPEIIENMTSAEFRQYLDNLGNETDAVAEDTEQAEPEPENAEVGTPPEEPAPAYRTFATQEEYEADRNKAISEAFDKRFKNAHERDEMLKRIERSAKSFYGDAEDPVGRMIQDLDAQAAEQSGQTVEEYRSAQSEAAELEAFRAEKAEREKRRRAEEQILADWRRGEADLKTIVPDFDLNDAMRDQAFASALSGGASVAQAYMAMQSSKPAPKPARREISQNAQGVRKGTGESQRNPAKLPPAEFNAYIESIRNG